MSTITETSIYYLVMHGREDNAIYVFLGRDPKLDGHEGVSATAVTLELLPPRQRFGGAGGVAMGMPMMGRWPGGISRFRQFLTLSEMEQANWVPISKYRICDCWDDYYSPWSFLESESPSGNEGPSQTQTHEGCDTDDDYSRPGSSPQIASIEVPQLPEPQAADQSHRRKVS